MNRSSAGVSETFKLLRTAMTALSSLDGAVSICVTGGITSTSSRLLSRHRLRGSFRAEKQASDYADNELTLMPFRRAPILLSAPQRTLRRYWLAGVGLLLFILTFVIGNFFLPAERRLTQSMVGHDFLAFY